MDALWQDVRYALRALARSPGFTAIGVLVLALAIGVNTAIFSLVNALIFKGIDVEDPKSLRFVVAEQTRQGRPEPVTSFGLSYRALLDLRKSDPLFADAFGFAQDRARLRHGREVRLAQGERVTANYFDMLRVRPAAGRLFNAADESPASESVVVISNDLWRARFDADPGVVGSVLPLDIVRYVGALTGTRPYTIIGVAPPGFRGMYKFQPTQYWVLHVQRAVDPDPDPRFAARTPDPIGSGRLAVALRVFDPARERHMASLLGGIARHIHTAHVPDAVTYTLRLEADRSNRVPFDQTGRIVPSRLAAGLLALAGLVALIGLSNLTGLLAARGVSRRTEMTVRLTLGASTLRVLRQAVIEGLAIAIAAAAVALLAVVWLLHALLAAIPAPSTSLDTSLPVVPGVPIDWRVLLYACGSALVATLVMATVPFRQSRRVNLLDDLREGGSSASGGIKPRLQRLILIPQIGSCVVLIVVSGVVARTLLREELKARGYDASGVVAVTYTRPFRPYPNYPYVPAEVEAYTAARTARIERVLLQIEKQTGARIALTDDQFRGAALPMTNSTFVARDGFSTSPRHTWLKMLAVTHQYFDVMRIPILLGRGFTRQDRTDSEPVVVVSQDLASRMWPGESAIGKYLGMHEPGSGNTPRAWRRIVGVAGNVSLPASEGNPTPLLYTLSQQSGSDGLLIARHDGDPSALAEHMKALLARADPDIMIAGTHMVSDAIDAMLFPRRLAAMVLALAAICGLVLACVGLYGIVSYSVAQRVREIGIRTTLGAQRRDIMRLVIRDGLVVTASGCAIGLALAYAGVKVVSSNLVALPSMGAGPFVAAPLILLAAMLLATYIPARRAALVDPMTALRRL